MAKRKYKQPEDCHTTETDLIECIKEAKEVTHQGRVATMSIALALYKTGSICSACFSKIVFAGLIADHEETPNAGFTAILTYIESMLDSNVSAANDIINKKPL